MSREKQVRKSLHGICKWIFELPAFKSWDSPKRSRDDENKIYCLSFIGMTELATVEDAIFQRSFSKDFCLQSLQTQIVCCRKIQTQALRYWYTARSCSTQWDMSSTAFPDQEKMLKSSWSFSKTIVVLSGGDGNTCRIHFHRQENKNQCKEIMEDE